MRINPISFYNYNKPAESNSFRGSKGERERPKFSAADFRRNLPQILAEIKEFEREQFYRDKDALLEQVRKNPGLGDDIIDRLMENELFDEVKCVLGAQLEGGASVSAELLITPEVVAQNSIYGNKDAMDAHAKKIINSLFTHGAGNAPGNLLDERVYHTETDSLEGDLYEDSVE